jgi:branched-chain amino acid transport system substrate-binding protein
MVKQRIAVVHGVLISLFLVACGGGGTPQAAQRLKIISSFPLTGGSNALSQAMINAIYLRLNEIDHKVCNGQYEITYEPWDDASAALGKWDPDVETQNAKKAVADGAVVAYIGTYNSGAAQIAIPILNQAQPGPLVMISPANGLPGLTKPGLGEPDEPEKYYPTGLRNYVRVIASNDVVGKVGARFVKNQLALQTVYILDDGDLYGRNIADVFERTAKELGLTVIGRESFDPKALNYQDLMAQIAVSNNGHPPRCYLRRA